MVRMTFAPGSPVPVTVTLAETVAPEAGEVIVPLVMVSFVIETGAGTSVFPTGSVNIAEILIEPSSWDEISITVDQAPALLMLMAAVTILVVDPDASEMVRTTFAPGSPVPVTVILARTVVPEAGDVIVPLVMVSFVIETGAGTNVFPVGSVNVAEILIEPSD